MSSSHCSAPDIKIELPVLIYVPMFAPAAAVPPPPEWNPQVMPTAELVASDRYAY
jgi:hypothetical protein